MKTKKLISLILALLMLISTLVSCNMGASDPEQTTTPDQATQPPETTDSYVGPADNAYLDIECYSSTGYKEESFAFDGSKHAITLNIPKEWELVAEEDSYALTKDGKRIGKIFSGKATDTKAWKKVSTKTNKETDFNVTMNIEKGLRQTNEGFRYRFIFSYHKLKEINTLTLIFNYEELDSAGCENILNTPNTLRITSPDYMGDLSHILPDSGRAEILILGNSFISSSEIEPILNEMFEVNNKPISATAVSTGFANVGTYINDSEIMSQIRAGRYQAVFLCGFYSQDQAEKSAIMKAACDASGTELVIFPAHNENALTPKDAASINNVICLNWQRELDMLINVKGIDHWDLCYDDGYKHTAPIGGYVGAQMIYRAIFNELPKERLVYSISQSQVNSILGDYVTTPLESALKNNKLHYLP